MVFKGHAYFNKHSAEALEIAQTPPRTHNMLFSMLLLSMFHQTIRGRSAGFSGKMHNRNKVVVSQKLLDTAEN